MKARVLTTVFLATAGLATAASDIATVKERTYTSRQPLYFRLVFDKDGKQTMLGVIDASKDKGAYDTVYLDENMNRDLTDDTAKPFKRYTDEGPYKGKLDPQISFTGPVNAETTAQFSIEFPKLAPHGSGNLDKWGYFDWSIAEQKQNWRCWFINGQMNFFTSASDALTGTPVRLGLGAGCKLDIRPEVRTALSIGVTDDNKCTLRTNGAGGPGEPPFFTLLQNGKVIGKREKMEFG